MSQGILSLAWMPHRSRRKADEPALEEWRSTHFGRHNGARGRSFDAQYKALAKRFGPFDQFSRQYASSVAGLFVEYRSASEVLAEAQRQRKEGKGRRPNQAAIARLQKRQGLAWESYDRSLQRLEALS